MTSAPLPLRSARLVLAIVVIAAANFAGGRLGLLLAIPPGYATAIFPPAGIALACVLLYGYRVWPGVWLGSFCINLSVAVSGLDVAALLQAAPVAAGIAAGSSLQAVVGAWSVRRVVGFPHALDSERAVAVFLGLGGPVSCLIAPLVGVATLWWAGVLPAADALESARTWWIGDVIGVFIFTPLVLIAFAKPRAVWRRRWLPVALPLVLLVVAIVSLFLRVSAWEQERIESAFAERAEDLATNLMRSIDSYMGLLYALDGLYAASAPVDREEFRAFAEHLRVRSPGLQALGWVPRVAGAERDNFEAMARREGYAGFQITELDGRGEQTPAAPRAAYFPAYYLAPEASNEIALGFDLGSEPNRAEALARARDTGELATSGRIVLVQDTERRAAVLVAYPIYSSRLRPVTVDQRRAQLEGFVAAVFRLDDLVATVFQGVSRQQIALRLDDYSGGLEGRELYRSGGAGAPGPSWLQQSFAYTRHGRSWRLTCSATPAYLAGETTWQPLAALAIGLLFTSLLTAFLLVVTGRGARIESLVAERTGELAQVNAQLAGNNAEVQRFYHTLAHELKTPLTAAREFVAIVLDGIAGPVGAEQREYLGIARESCDQMTRLLNDLLDSARLETGKFSLDRQPAAIDEVAGQVVAELASLARDRGIHVRQAIPPGLPSVLIDRQRIAQVLVNLLNNALKFTDAGGRITVRASADPERPEYVRVAVADTGRGIAAADLEAVFERLYQVRESDVTTAGGLGLGLSLCRGIVRQHGGEIWAESKLGVGSTFFFTLPMAPGAVAGAAVDMQQPGALGMGA